MIGIEVDMRQVNAGLKALVESVKNISRPLRSFGAEVVRRTKLSMPSQEHGSPSAVGSPPASHHGGIGLRGSVTYNVLEGQQAVEIGTPLVYGAIQQTGGKILPVEAKALAVPISPTARGRRPRDFDDLFIFQSTSGKHALMLGREVGKGKNRKLEPMFILLRSVTLPARPWLEITVEDADYLGNELQKQFEREMKI